MLPEWQKAVVTQISQVTPLTRRYWLELPDTLQFDFRPGQFVTLDLPIHEKRNKRWRSYSIASMPDGTNVIELVIVQMEGGAGTDYLFNQVDVGSELVLRGPQGVFVLPEHVPDNLILICTGTGIAPFRSMLHYIHKHNIPHKNIHLLFGTRTRVDLLYYDEMRALEQELRGFTYHPVLSRDKWEYDSGYVHHIYERICSDNPPAHFMLCGWKVMVDEARERLLNMGYEKKDIHLELYG